MYARYKNRRNERWFLTQFDFLLQFLTCLVSDIILNYEIFLITNDLTKIAFLLSQKRTHCQQSSLLLRLSIRGCIPADFKNWLQGSVGQTSTKLRHMKDITLAE